MSATAELLESLDAVAHEATLMLNVLDVAEITSDSARKEAKRRVLEIRAKAQELFDWLSETRLERPVN